MSHDQLEAASTNSSAKTPANAGHSDASVLSSIIRRPLSIARLPVGLGGSLFKYLIMGRWGRGNAEGGSLVNASHHRTAWSSISSRRGAHRTEVDPSAAGETANNPPKGISNDKLFGLFRSGNEHRETADARTRSISASERRRERGTEKAWMSRGRNWLIWNTKHRQCEGDAV